jgi:hypothetical protein
MTDLDLAVSEPLLCNAELNLELAAKRLSVVKAKACTCTSYTLADLCQQYLGNPEPQARELILRAQVKTRSDALSVLALLEQNEDAEIAAHLLRMMRVHLSAA